MLKTRQYYAASDDYTTFNYAELIEEQRQVGEKQLGELARSIRKQCPVKTVIESGHPGNLIVEAAHRLGSELIIMATHGRTGFKRAFLGSAAEFVVRHARVPVLTLREQERRSI